MIKKSSINSDAFQTTENQLKNSKYIWRIHNLMDGAKVLHVSNFVSDSTNLFEELKNKIHWSQMEVELYDKKVLTPRYMHVIHFENFNSLPLLQNLREQMEKITDTNFTYGVLNYYRDGNDYISYHADRETDSNQIVVSVSLGATRQFIFKHKYRKNLKHKFMLRDSDVLIINEAAIKTKYKHSVPKMKKVGPRINITFRQ
jgi:alkylated DNA repair dioxygenase AlkB